MLRTLSPLVWNGLRILGLGGCGKYHPGPFQYTEAQMRRRIARLREPRDDEGITKTPFHPY